MRWPHSPDDFYRSAHGADDARWVDPTQTREKSSHPYSYDAFFLWGNRAVAKAAADVLYSDRIWQWDREKADRCWAAHVKKNWGVASLKELSAFLTAYLGKPTRAVALAEGCNVGNGYPYWIVWLKHPPAENGASSPAEDRAGNPATDEPNPELSEGAK